MTAEFLGDLGGAQSPPAQRDDAGAEYPVAGSMAALGEFVDLALLFGIFWRASVKQFRHVLFTFPFGGSAASLCIPSLRNRALSLRFNREGFCDGLYLHRKIPRSRPLHRFRQPF